MTIAVIQCAAGKRSDAGCLRTGDGRKVVFVARPRIAPSGGRRIVHARPDDISDTGKPWRTVLARYNAADAGKNPLGLLPAWQLYKHPAYRMLAEHCGEQRLYILSAGWGLIRADFLTPAYDITFSKGRKVAACKRRGKSQIWSDFAMLPPDCDEPIVFFGGRDYLPLFCTLTENAAAPRLVWHNSDVRPVAPGCRVRRFRIAARTNWHYQCARAYVEGRLAGKAS